MVVVVLTLGESVVMTMVVSVCLLKWLSRNGNLNGNLI
jgi:hypothetical protein